MNNRKIFYDFLNWVGITISDNSSAILGYVLLVLSVICIICAVNILIYLIVKKIIEHPKELEKCLQTTLATFKSQIMFITFGGCSIDREIVLKFLT